MNKIILASTSPYRSELLKRLSISFDCLAPDVDEESYKSLGLAPLELCQKLALAKAKAVSSSRPNSIVIGSDQVAFMGEVIFDKPGDFAKAAKQLELLSGKEHQLATAVAIEFQEQSFAFTELSTLKMRELSKSQIAQYLKRDKPFSCAGSYMLESAGISLFEEVRSSDHSAITGLPLLWVSRILNQLGIIIPPKA